MAEHICAVVIGAGVVGLAVARALAERGREVIVVERHERIGQETSSRNSGVIHSGIYYPKESLKARLCVAGRKLLYNYCGERQLAHRRCGKLIVAQSEQLVDLKVLGDRALANGVADLRWLEQDEVIVLEPTLHCAAALLSPSTGIIDVHEYMQALHADLEAADGQVIMRTEFLNCTTDGVGFRVRLRSGAEEFELCSEILVNSAGLSAVGLLNRIEQYPKARLRRAFFAKGNYFILRGARPFRHLIYPMPNEAGLGVHATLGLDGTIRFGPDVEWVETVDYAVDESRGDAFYAEIRRYWPSLPDNALLPDFAGIRPKLVGAGQAAADFVIETPLDHGISGLINLLGIESPGLTSSLAIGDYVRTFL
jgi:L-2-hydroxyglutarate oxidase LhgO